jgi:hypothetical protein
VPIDYAEGNYEQLFVTIDDKAYFTNSRGITQVFDGNNVSTYKPRTIFPEELNRRTSKIGRVATYKNIGYRPVTFGFGSPDNTLSFYRLQ